MAVYLYTSRVVIEALGLIDYGIYDVVGSVVLAMMFFNNSMLNCTQRYITCSLAENDGKQVNKIFSHSIFIHLVFGVLIGSFWAWIVASLFGNLLFPILNAKWPDVFMEDMLTSFVYKLCTDVNPMTYIFILIKKILGE